MLKQELRIKYINKRKALNKPQFWAFNDAILNHLQFLDWHLYNYVSLFLPIASHNEIDTFEILNYFTQNHPHLKIGLPKSDFKDYSLQHLEYTEQTVLIKNKQNVPEPLYGEIISPTKFDVVFVPLLAYDKQGFRVGYGKGFYDRFLATCKPTALKIGLSFFDAEEQIMDIDGYDIKLNKCITPHKVCTF